VLTGLVTAAFCAFVFKLSRRDRISANNVNDEWGGHSEALEHVKETPKSEVSV
jgi:hypothetical protein